MGRAPCCEKMGLKKGAWTTKEDDRLISYIQQHGHPNWRALPKQAGLLRCGKSCRLRWMNYLRPGIKRGNFTKEEEETIIRLHQLMGNRWSAIAVGLPGRTDNEIKNVWHSKLKMRVKKDPPGTVYYSNKRPHDEDSLAPTTQPAPVLQRSNSSNALSIDDVVGRKEMRTIASLNQSIIDRGLWTGDEMGMEFWEESTDRSANHGYHYQVHGDDNNNCQIGSSCSKDGIGFWYNIFVWSSLLPES